MCAIQFVPFIFGISSKMLRPATRSVRRIAQVSTNLLRSYYGGGSALHTLHNASGFGHCVLQNSRLDCLQTRRTFATSVPKSKQSEELPVDELLAMIERSREQEDPEREVKQSLELFEILKRRSPQDADTFQVAFGIAQIYDGQLDDMEAAVTYYEEAMVILDTITTEATAWEAYMRVTTLGALAICYENLDQLEEADKYFNRAISAYEQHCDQATTSDTDEEDASETDLSLLADLNASAAMVYYHYAGSLLPQADWEEVRNLTEAALMLAENSSMPSEDLEELQRCVHDLWLDMESKER